MPAVSLHVALREGVSLTAAESGDLLLRTPDGATPVKHLPTQTRALFQKLNPPGEGEGRLAEQVLRADGAGALQRFQRYVAQLGRWDLLVRSAQTEGRPLASLDPFATPYDYPQLALAAHTRYVLSRFACLRRDAGQVVVETPLECALLVLHDSRAAALFHSLNEPGTCTEVRARTADLPPEAADQLLLLLLNARAIGAADDDDGTCVLDRDADLHFWEFHDLYFHSRSRRGAQSWTDSATYRFLGQGVPPPAVKPPMSRQTIDLYRPDLERLEREDPPLSWVQRQRRSIRSYGAEPIGIEPLGEFLYRVGRVTGRHTREFVEHGQAFSMEFAERPYPSGGALHELEFYLSVAACRGLAAGFYHYDAANHRLEHLADVTPAVQQLLADAAQAIGVPPEKLQVVVTIAARLPRYSWKYAGKAYAGILKHVGVVYQTMYLTATAMGLAPCGVGAGDSDCFARAAGVNYYTETSVGEFTLGTRG